MPEITSRMVRAGLTAGKSRRTSGELIGVHLAPAPMEEEQAHRGLADLLSILMQYRREYEAEGHRFVDSAGNPLPLLKP